MPKAAQDAPVVDDVVIETPEQILAAQQEGFTEAVTSTPVPSEPVAKTDEQIAQEAAAVAEAEKVAAKAKEDAEKLAAKEAEDKPVLAGYTAKQLTAALDKAKQFDGLKKTLDTVSGKFGSVEAKLKELTEAKSAGIQMTDADVAELKEEYGPELAGALLKTLNKFGAKIGGGTQNAAPVVPDAVDAQAKIDAAVKAASDAADAKLSAATRETELKFLTREHKDWRTIVQGEPLLNADGTPQVDAQGRQLRGLKTEFAAWVKTLPGDEQKRLDSSWDADFLSEKISAYKAHIATQKAEADAAAVAAKKQASTPVRVTAAIAAKSLPGTVTGKTALDEQKEGYASA